MQKGGSWQPEEGTARKRDGTARRRDGTARRRDGTARRDGPVVFLIQLFPSHKSRSGRLSHLCPGKNHSHSSISPTRALLWLWELRLFWGEGGDMKPHDTRPPSSLPMTDRYIIPGEPAL